MSIVTQILLSILIIITTHLGESRSLSKNSSSLISDGMQHVISLQSDHPVVELEFKATTVTCEPIYGFLPCTTEVWGQLFMIVVYEVLLSIAGTYVSDGSNLFFQMFGTGVFGASVFQMLGTIPQVVLILGNQLSFYLDHSLTIFYMLTLAFNFFYKLMVQILL
jgi:hypothetical protein